MSDHEEDFAAMFEASTQAKRLDQGELVEGRIVAIGPEVALVDVGRKGEAVIDIAELKNADGEIEVALGDRVQAMVVSTQGGLTLSRRLAEIGRERSAVRGCLSRRPASGREGRAADQGRL